jgi:hypothetical protein
LFLGLFLFLTLAHFSFSTRGRTKRLSEDLKHRAYKSTAILQMFIEEKRSLEGDTEEKR